MPPNLCHAPRVHRLIPSPLQRRRRGRPHRRVLLDPLPRRAHEYRGQERRQRVRVALPLRRRRPAPGLARYHRVPHPPRAPRGFAARVAEGDDPGAAQGRGPFPGADPGHLKVPPVHDRLLLPQRPSRSHTVLVRQQPPEHRPDGVPPQDHQGSRAAPRDGRRHAHAGHRGHHRGDARARGVRAQVPTEGGWQRDPGAQAGAAQG
mmetsp:Transcript_3061/g.13779  ORF Transcript_3061/g.13779 Transcript_3061/m.13779 type:complete len:205 (-) Transcript_3061:137-751(-)